MRYLIDGHNLIPKIKNLSLHDIDDEEKLIALLNRFSTKARAQVEVYFDKAPIDSARSIKIGAIKVHFIRTGSSADAAMIERIKKMGTSAQGITVVSSDHAIQNAALRMKLKVVSSDEFARLIEQKLTRSGGMGEKETTLSDDEIDEWLRLFGKEKT
jgi:predicted RNA-binding protein with PIN domain